MSGPYHGWDLSNCSIGRLLITINCGVLSVEGMHASSYIKMLYILCCILYIYILYIGTYRKALNMMVYLESNVHLHLNEETRGISLQNRRTFFPRQKSRTYAELKDNHVTMTMQRISKNWQLLCL